jgi:hypothetical protein
MRVAVRDVVGLKRKEEDQRGQQSDDGDRAESWQEYFFEASFASPACQLSAK